MSWKTVKALRTAKRAENYLPASVLPSAGFFSGFGVRISSTAVSAQGCDR